MNWEIKFGLMLNCASLLNNNWSTTNSSNEWWFAGVALRVRTFSDVCDDTVSFGGRQWPVVNSETVLREISAAGTTSRRTDQWRHCIDNRWLINRCGMISQVRRHSMRPPAYDACHGTCLPESRNSSCPTAKFIPSTLFGAATPDRIPL